MARTTSFRLSTSAVALLLPLLLSLTTAPAVVHGDRVELVNFEFEDRVPPNNTVVVSASPSGNKTSGEFGTLRVVTNVLRKSMDPESEVLGSVVGLVNSLRDDAGLFLTFNFVYDTEEWKGTLAVQGQLDSSSNGELVVTGGSGDFRFARGFCVTTLVAQTDPANITFKNVIHLKF